MLEKSTKSFKIRKKWVSVHPSYEEIRTALDEKKMADFDQERL